MLVPNSDAVSIQPDPLNIERSQAILKIPSQLEASLQNAQQLQPSLLQFGNQKEFSKLAHTTGLNAENKQDERIRKSFVFAPISSEENITQVEDEDEEGEEEEEEDEEEQEEQAVLIKKQLLPNKSD